MRTPVIGYLLRAALLIVLGAVLLPFWVLLIVLLRVLRPFIVWPMLLGCLGGMGATAHFAMSRMWMDALRAGSVTMVCALVFGLYSAAVQVMDAGRFDEVPNRFRRGVWASWGQSYYDEE